MLLQTHLCEFLEKTQDMLTTTGLQDKTRPPQPIDSAIAQDPRNRTRHRIQGTRGLDP